MSTDESSPASARVDRGPDAYRELFERSADAILIIEGESFVDCNQATVEMLRLPDKAAVLRTHPSELSPVLQPDGRRSFEKANEMSRIAFERGSHRFEWEHMRADGEVFPVEVLLTAVEAGDRPSLHVVWRDITVRRQLESELRHAQKMEAIGNLAGGIAHDFNNLLVAILGNAELLAMTLEGRGDDKLRLQAQEICNAGTRAADLTRQLLAYSRKQVFQPRVVDLTAVIRDLERMLHRLIGEDVQLQIRAPRALVPVKADPGQLQQVILNLATNARDAMPEGGSLVVDIRSTELSPDTIGGPPGLPAGGYAVVDVSDTGTGMDEETLAKAFDPFFTTKKQGEGTGLGLSTVHGIVRQSRGDITVRSVVGDGTIFRIFLPLSHDALQAPTTRPSAEPGRLSGDERILVVEDEQAVANLVLRVLRNAGYEVEHAHDGQQGLEVLCARGDAFDLVISDVIMSNMSGPEMIRHLNRPSLKVLYASGYTDQALSSRGGLDPGVELLRKPFTPVELLTRVRTLLNG